MMKWFGEFRLMPVVLIATGCLFALKTIGLIFDGGYTLGQRLGGDSLVVTTVPMSATAQMRSPSTPLDVASVQPQDSKRSWMQEMFNYPSDITGSVAAKPKDAPNEAAKESGKQAAAEPGKEATAGEHGKSEPPATQAPPETKPAAAGTLIPMDQTRPASAGERALLERLQERRQHLDARARELDLREAMLKAAEKKLETQSAALKAEDAKGGTPAQREENSDKARFKGLVTMYETMKPKDAAKIFDRLDIKILLEMASKIKPARMSEILAQMSPDMAERLTVELAARSGAERAMNPSSLPKIDGQPGGT
jgi:flagellar motility protein MotE (MotC chaperone)